MPSPPERSRIRLVVYGFLAAVVLLGLIPGYLMLDASWRPIALRLACAAIVVVGCIRLVAGVGRSIEPEPPSLLDLPPRPRARPEVDERFLRLRDDLRFSTVSRTYFEAHLWPRLCRIAGSELPLPSRERRGRRRGPSVGMLGRLIDDLERRMPS